MKYQILLLERVDKPVKGGGRVDVEMGVATFFITLQFNHIYCVWGEGGGGVVEVRFPLLLFGSSVL